MGSPAGGIGPRSSANHAGVPAVNTVIASWATATTGHQIVATPGDGRRIRLLGWSIGTAGVGAYTFNLCSSAAAGTPAATSLTGGNMNIAGGTSVTQPPTTPGNFNGVGDCVVGEDLCISGAGSGGTGLFTYSLVP